MAAPRTYLGSSPPGRMQQNSLPKECRPQTQTTFRRGQEWGKWGSITPGKADARKDSLFLSLPTTNSPERYLLYQVKSRTTQHQMPSYKKEIPNIIWGHYAAVKGWRASLPLWLHANNAWRAWELLTLLNLDGFLSQLADPSSSPQQAPSWVAFWFYPVIHSSRELYAQGHCSQTGTGRGKWTV